MADFAGALANMTLDLEERATILETNLQLTEADLGHAKKEMARLQTENAMLQQQVAQLQSDKDKGSETIRTLSAHVLDLKAAYDGVNAHNDRMRVTTGKLIEEASRAAGEHSAREG